MYITAVIYSVCGATFQIFGRIHFYPAFGKSLHSWLYTSTGLSRTHNRGVATDCRFVFAHGGLWVAAGTLLSKFGRCPITSSAAGLTYGACLLQPIGALYAVGKWVGGEVFPAKV